MEGKIYESNHRDYSYTTFTGYLVEPLSDSGFRPPRRNDFFPENDDFNRQCCCSRVCPVEPNNPPYSPPSYYPPSSYQPPPPYSTRPPFIVTTTQGLPSYHRPVATRPTIAPIGPPAPPPSPSIIIGRDDGGEKCCKSILVSANAASASIELQKEKFGVFRLQYVRPSDGRGVYKHCDNDVYLFYYQRSGWSGWLIGPEEGQGRGGMLVRSDKKCVELIPQGRWLYYDKTTFVPDATIGVSCFTEGFLDGRELNLRKYC